MNNPQPSRKECDLSTTGLYITAERSEAVDFSLPLYRDTIGFVVKSQGGATAPNYWVYMDVFRTQLWMAVAIVAACFATGFSMVSLRESILESAATALMMLLQLDSRVETGSLSKR